MLLLGLLVCPASAITNLAYNKSVSVSGFLAPPTSTENIVDSNFSTSSVQTMSVESVDDTDYIQIDLEAIYNLSSIKLKIYDENGAAYIYTNLKYSSDGSTWTTLHEYQSEWLSNLNINDTFSDIDNVRYIRSTVFSLGGLSFQNWYEIQAYPQIYVTSSNANPTHILKCGESTISATFSDAGITTVDAILTSVKPVKPMVPGSGRVTTETETTVVPMTWNGTYWVGTFGNDADLLWGERTVTYLIDGTNSFSSSSTVFVYSDTCTGTGLTNYTQNTPSLMGNYTKKLWQGMDPVSWILYPWLQVWGYLFYVLVTFTIVTTIYLKTQNVTQPLVIGIFLLLIFASTSVVDVTYRQWVIFIIGLALSALYYKVFVRD